MRACTPFVTEPIGTSSIVRSGQRPCHISRETSPCSAETPFAYDDVRSANGVSPKLDVVGLHAAERDELVPGEPAARDERRDVPLDERRVEDLVPGRHGRVRREHGRRAQPLQRRVAREAAVLDELAQPLELEERRVALVHVEDGRLEPEPAQHAHAADAEHELLPQPVLAVAAVELVGDRPRPVGVAVDVGVEQVERHAPDLRAPHLHAHGHERAGARRRARRPRCTCSSWSGSRAGSFSG